MDITSEPASSNCPTGGLNIKSGIDKNNNNKLDSNEVENTKYICNGTNGGYDKQIVLEIINGGGNTTSTNGFIGGELIKFNKANFTNVDSIVFVSTSLYCDDTDVNPGAILELYNITDNLPIANGKLISSKSFANRGFQQTNNLYNFLPDKEVTLGIRLSSKTQGAFAGVYTSYLVLYRK